MKAVLPGNPVPATQAICTGYWDGIRYIAYITGNALVILTGSLTLLQAIYDESGDQLRAIAFDETTGKIAVCTEYSVRIYKSYGQSDDGSKWCLQDTFSLDTAKAVDLASYLSWGISEELLVGGDSLELLSTITTPRVVWKSSLANQVKFAEFSYDSAFIASAGRYDRFVKIWRRLSFGSDDTRFDFSYLSHPAAITNLQWRKPNDINHTIDNVLYTTCADQVLRIWAALDFHDHSTKHLQLWGQIDLTESIKPRALLNHSNIRYSFIIDGSDFLLAMEKAVQSKITEEMTENHALSHLIEVSTRSPEICIILDDIGHMSAWGLENISYKTIQKRNIFNIAHVDGLSLGLPHISESKSSQVRCYNFFDKPSGALNILIHNFDGTIEVFESNLADLFDPSPRHDRLVSKTTIMGHSASIKNILNDVHGLMTVSQTDYNENIVWKHTNLEGGQSVSRQCIFTENNQSHGIWVLSGGNFVICLFQDNISFWDTRCLEGKLIARSTHSLVGKTLCTVLLSEIESESAAYIAAISSHMKGIVWKVQLPSSKILEVNGCHSKSIQEFCSFDLHGFHDVSKILTIDTPGSFRTTSRLLSCPNRDVAMSYTHSGIVRIWTARLDLTLNRVNWIQSCSIDTGICDPTLASGSSARKVAIVDSQETELTIWDIRGENLEYSQNYEAHDTIKILKWTLTSDAQSILAVGFSFRVILLVQMPYNYLDRSPSWAVIKEFNILDLTPHPIGDFGWISNGNLIVGTGNQLLILDKMVDLSVPVIMDLHLPHRRLGWDAFEVASQLNGLLPVYHPQFLIQSILASKDVLVQHVIIQLFKTLKYYVPGEPIDSFLNIDLQYFYTSPILESMPTEDKVSKRFSLFSDEDNEDESVTEAVASFVVDKLANLSLPQLSRNNQKYLEGVVKCIALVNRQRRSIDENAAKFMLFFHLHALCRDKSKRESLTWREINWAYHSNSQEILVDMVSRQYNGRLLWEHARECGIFMWIQDPVTLATQFENIARNEYSKTDMKNPVDCTLFYLALRKKKVLQGLWRIAAWNREQAATIRLLANNFNDKKWKTAAMKNAYALLGKHRYEYAASFFLLADCLRDAVYVILNQLKDLQLAITIARVYEGDGGLVLKELLEHTVLPLACQEGNRWLASWAFWLLHKKDMSVRVLLIPDPQSRSFLVDDPALLNFYSQLHRKTTLRDPSSLTQEIEWSFVLHYARSYCRMGCDSLALDLIRNWKFLKFSADSSTISSLEPQLASSRRCSNILLDISSKDLPSNANITGHRQTPVVFKEPNSSSLLDSFGF